MTKGFASRPPEALARVRTTHGEAGAGLGELCRLLAASRPAGVFLVLGRGAGVIGAWIHDGMDLSGRLVIVVDQEEAEALGPAFADDLRITVHVQDAAEFIRDVHAHRFDLIADLSPDTPTPSAIAVLAPGGFYVTPRPLTDPEQTSAIAQSPEGTGTDEFICAHLPLDPATTIIVRGPRSVRLRRRGGRRARQGVTPLFSSRSRRRGK